MARLRFWIVSARRVGIKCDSLSVSERASVGAASENHCTTDTGSRHRGSPDSVGEAVAIARRTSGHRLVRVRGRDNSQHRALTSTNPSVIREYTAAQSARFRASQSAMKRAVVFDIDAHFERSQISLQGPQTPEVGGALPTQCVGLTDRTTADACTS
jgi:hypothetical protein